MCHIGFSFCHVGKSLARICVPPISVDWLWACHFCGPKEVYTLAGARAPARRSDSRSGACPWKKLSTAEREFALLNIGARSVCAEEHEESKEPIESKI